MSELRGARRLATLRQAGARTLQEYPSDPAIERLATYLNERYGYAFKSVAPGEVVDAAIKQLEFAADANRKFCDTNAKLDRVVTATMQALRKEGWV